MSVFRAAYFYVEVLLSSLGLKRERYSPKKSELNFQDWALSQSKLAVHCGPRTDTEFVEMATSRNCDSVLFEASPVFARVLAKKLSNNIRTKVINVGVSSEQGSLKYFYLNQSFVRNLGFPSLNLYRQVQVTTLDNYFYDKPKPDFIATDIEGYDIEAYRGARDILKQSSFFQLEMPSTSVEDYLDLFEDFNMCFLFDSDHPLWELSGRRSIVSVDELGWETVFNSMRKGDTNVLVGVRKGIPIPKVL
jgi:FkbM family methyltransferase